MVPELLYCIVFKPCYEDRIRNLPLFLNVFFSIRFSHSPSDKRDPVCDSQTFCRNIFCELSLPSLCWAAGFISGAADPQGTCKKILSSRRGREQWLFMRSVGSGRSVGLGILLFLFLFPFPFSLVSSFPLSHSYHTPASRTPLVPSLCHVGLPCLYFLCFSFK